MSELVRVCPACRSERVLAEVICLAPVGGAACGTDLSLVPLVQPGISNGGPLETPAAPPVRITCTSGHALSPGDELCVECGAGPAAATPGDETAEPPADAASVTSIDGWQIVSRIPVATDRWEQFFADSPTGARKGVLTLYACGAEPDPNVQNALRRTDLAHVPQLYAAGRWQAQAYEVFERIDGGSIADAGWILADDPALLRAFVEELGRALAAFAEIGLRHRDLRPQTILVRRRSPLDLVITGFGSARLSELDLEVVALLRITRYAAPEAIAGSVSAASDWWSLGMVLLEQLSRGECFAGTNEQAWGIHVVTRGVSIPESIEERARLVLRGLLVRDPSKRWGWREVSEWLSGGSPEVHGDVGLEDEVPSEKSIRLGGRAFTRASEFALLAAEEGNCDEARGLLLRGTIATWLSERGGDARLASEVRRIAALDDLSEDWRLALALMVMNPALPLVQRGEIVNPGWLLAHVEQGYEAIAGSLVEQLARLDREPWLVRLRCRADSVRQRAQRQEVELDEVRLRPILLATSRANLDADLAVQRSIYPDSDHPALASLLDRPRLSEEDVILLLAAQREKQFTPVASLLEDAERLARSAGVAFEREMAQEWLRRPRREVYAEIERRIAGFARCGNAQVDDWADGLRAERRISLPRAVVLLSLDEKLWQRASRQAFFSRLLEIFEKRVVGSVLRGPLVRFLIGRTTARVDLSELQEAEGGAAGATPGLFRMTPQGLLDRILERSATDIRVHPSALGANETLFSRFRKLVNHANTFRRDTGVDSRYLAFPFVVVRSEGRQPRIAPVLLWPVRVDLSARGEATIAFDSERKEIRLNPALGLILRSNDIDRWIHAKDELLSRPTLRTGDVVDGFAGLAAPRGRTLVRLPGPGTAPTSAAGIDLVCAASLFNAEFSGQSISEDLRRLRSVSPENTGLGVALRVSEPVTDGARSLPALPESERWTVLESDPSQERAVQMARVVPGIHLEGPPGTGKSQTIVSVIVDSVARGESVLVVCQKQAALRVVEKRLERHGLGERLLSVSDVHADRVPIVKTLKQQLDGLGPADSQLERMRQEREALTKRIDGIEQELDQHHAANRRRDPVSNLTYREIVAELVELDHEAERPLEIAGLRRLLLQLGPDKQSSPPSHSRVTGIVDALAPLAPLWLESEYEDSPLAVLRPFVCDESVAADLERDLVVLLAKDAAHLAARSAGRDAIEVSDAAPWRAWLDSRASWLRGLDVRTWSNLAAWQPLFRVGPEGNATGHGLIQDLREFLNRIDALDGEADAALSPALIPLKETELRILQEVVDRFLASRSPWRWLSPAWWADRGEIRRFLAEAKASGSATRVPVLDAAMRRERELRKGRKLLERARALLGLSASGPIEADDRQLQREITAILDLVAPVLDALAAIAECPDARAATMMAERGSVTALLDVERRIASGIEIFTARQEAKAAVGGAAQWFEHAWVVRCGESIDRGESIAKSVDVVRRALPRAGAFQRFRLQAGRLSPEVMSIFAAFRPVAERLKLLPADRMEAEFRRVLRREALLLWKNAREQADPVLLRDCHALRGTVERLRESLTKVRELNGTIVAGNVDRSAIGSQADWKPVLLQRGPNALRLREIVDRGIDLGLMRLRPVWLLNPDVASSLLPVRGGLFDVVVFDEASQMLVQNAIPSLFRGKRIVISGDEKQMPPTSFFASRFDQEEEDTEDEFDEDATEAERVAAQEKWDRREITSCPDLLALGREVLPPALLEFHYRSAYRELIAFSNHAFYGATLHVPVRHPDAEVLKARPIEVIRVNGLYEKQTNRAETQRIVELLAGYWCSPSQSSARRCPTIGVVTFNRPQADLIEEALQTRAADDEAFRDAWDRERNRTENGEDVGFFVKNVENVQGDERDVIVFSTTFGRDARGVFRRNFGVLGQTGGERRLNVAVTRARQKVQVVTSMPVDRVSDFFTHLGEPRRARDFLQAYLDYATRVSDGALEQGRRALERFTRTTRTTGKGGPAGSDAFVAAVSKFVRELGHEPVSVSDGDAFALDLALVDPSTGLFGLAIECDAPDHERLSGARMREIWRADMLRRGIPQVHRISCRDWYHDSGAEKRRLAEAIRRTVGGMAA